MGDASLGLLTAGDTFTRGELEALAGRGVVEPLLPGVYAVADDDGDPRLRRAGALWHVAGPQLAAGWTAIGPTAAWVHVGGPAPGRLHAAVAHFHRLPAGGAALPWALRETDVAAPAGRPAPAEHDVERLGPVRVTVPERTVEDLLLQPSPSHMRLAARILARHGSPELRERLARRTRRPGAVAARRALETLLAAYGL